MSLGWRRYHENALRVYIAYIVRLLQRLLQRPPTGRQGQACGCGIATFPGDRISGREPEAAGWLVLVPELPTNPAPVVGKPAAAPGLNIDVCALGNSFLRDSSSLTAAAGID